MSKLVQGDESAHFELRLRTVLELALHVEFYETHRTFFDSKESDISAMRCQMTMSDESARVMDRELSFGQNFSLEVRFVS